MILVKTASVLWGNSVLKSFDALLAKISSNITYKYKVKMHNAPIFHSTELLPLDLVKKAAERSSKVPRDGGIRKATFFERRLPQPSGHR